eukprot:8742318-Prorocentrum_lima.AAC.1
MRKGTREAIVRLAVGDTDAIYWHEEVFCNGCKTPLIAANLVVNVLKLVAMIVVKIGRLWINDGETCELLVIFKRR